MFQHFPFFMCIHAIPVLYFIGRLYLEVDTYIFSFHVITYITQSG